MASSGAGPRGDSARAVDGTAGALGKMRVVRAGSQGTEGREGCGPSAPRAAAPPPAPPDTARSAAARAAAASARAALPSHSARRACSVRAAKSCRCSEGVWGGRWGVGGASEMGGWHLARAATRHLPRLALPEPPPGPPRPAECVQTRTEAQSAGQRRQQAAGRGPRGTRRRVGRVRASRAATLGLRKPPKGAANRARKGWGPPLAAGRAERRARAAAAVAGASALGSPLPAHRPADPAPSPPPPHLRPHPTPPPLPRPPAPPAAA